MQTYDAPTIHYSDLPPAAPDSPLRSEWETYRREVARLLAEGQEGRWLLIKEEEIIGIWDTREEATEEGYRRYLLSGFLIHQIQVRERVLRGPFRGACEGAAPQPLAGASG